MGARGLLFMTHVGSSLVTNVSRGNPPGIIDLTAFLAAPNWVDRNHRCGDCVKERNGRVRRRSPGCTARASGTQSARMERLGEMVGGKPIVSNPGTL